MANNYPTLGDADIEPEECSCPVGSDDGPEMEYDAAELARMDSLALDG